MDMGGKTRRVGTRPVGEGHMGMGIHLVLLTLSCCAFAAAAAGGPLTDASAEGRRVRDMTLLITAALIIGNIACLLPETPIWYSTTLVVATAAGFVWLLVSGVSARKAARIGRRLGSPAAERTPAHTEAPARRLSVVTAVPTPPTITTLALPDRRTVERSDLAALSNGPATSGQGVYVARNIGIYAPTAVRRRTHGVAFRPRQHPAAAAATAVRRQQLATAYAADQALTLPTRSTKA